MHQPLIPSLIMICLHFDPKLLPLETKLLHSNIYRNKVSLRYSPNSKIRTTRLRLTENQIWVLARKSPNSASLKGLIMISDLLS